MKSEATVIKSSRGMTIKRLLGELPWTAELYWQLIQGGRALNRKTSLQSLQDHLPGLMAQASEAARQKRRGNTLPAKTAGEEIDSRRIFVFAMLRYWIEQASVMSLALAGMGHQVTLAFLPYANWQRPVDRFDLRRQNAYIKSVLKGVAPLIKILPLLEIQSIPGAKEGKVAPLDNTRRQQAQPATPSFPEELYEALEQVAIRDTQYTLQLEDVPRHGKNTPARLYRLRLRRVTQAANAMLVWLKSLPQEEWPELIITPNGSILEMGAVYQVARYLHIPVVTYEFGEQRGRIWLAHNSEVMLQETSALWEAQHARDLNESEWEQMRQLYNSRQKARLWQNFGRLWQGQPSQGGEQARQALQLDDRPVVLLAANVIGDSLTLGRQVFSRDMSEWLQRSVQYFANRADVQLVVRIHPGERYLKGPSVAEVVQQALPEIPLHIHLVGAAEPVNTYDLIEIADLGLVYTTTVGMEMAMSGVPVIVGGKTHYRGKGFTIDPNSWEAYHAVLNEALNQAGKTRLSQEQIEKAWRYAYLFFFEYPRPFPWHLLDLWKDLESWPLSKVLSVEGQAIFANTFRSLSGQGEDKPTIFMNEASAAQQGLSN